MNTYFIQQKIKTVAEIGPFEGKKPALKYLDIDFLPWEFNWADGQKGNAWVAQGAESAENYHDAVISFRKKLSSIVPKIAFVSQCYMDFVSESFLVHRRNNNPENILFIHCVFGHSPGLIFMEDEVDSLNNLDSASKEFFWYMNDCYNSTGYTAKILLLFAALENLAGKEIKTKEDGQVYETYNKDVMKEILGDEMFGKMYGTSGFRHKLSHGDYIDVSFSGENVVEKLHKLILGYFNKKFNTKLDLAVVGPQRNFSGNSYYTNAFLKPKDVDVPVDIRLFFEDFELNKREINKLEGFSTYFPTKQKIY